MYLLIRLQLLSIRKNRSHCALLAQT